jgi:hypothetical protein
MDQHSEVAGDLSHVADAHDVWSDPASSRDKHLDMCKACNGHGKDFTNQSCQRCGGSGKVRVASKTATMIDTFADKLNPGDSVRLPNGKTQRITRVRKHETSGSHVYVDTDGGTALVKRNQGFSVVPVNNTQQHLPGYGTPGGNSNSIPWDKQTGGDNTPGGAPGAGHGVTQCPNCSGVGSLKREGDHFKCARCGYRENFGGAGGATYTDQTHRIQNFSSRINERPMSAIARRASEMLMLNQTGTDVEETP